MRAHVRVRTHTHTYTPTYRPPAPIMAAKASMPIPAGIIPIPRGKFECEMISLVKWYLLISYLRPSSKIQLYGTIGKVSTIRRYLLNAPSWLIRD